MDKRKALTSNQQDGTQKINRNMGQKQENKKEK